MKKVIEIHERPIGWAIRHEDGEVAILYKELPLDEQEATFNKVGPYFLSMYEQRRMCMEIEKWAESQHVEKLED